MQFRRLVRAVCATCLLTLTLMAAGPARAQQVNELNFGIIPAELAPNVKKEWQPFIDDMSKAVGMKVNAFFASDYAAVIEGMRFNKVQLAWFGNKSAMEAVDRADGEIFAQTITLDGNPGYYSLLISHKDSDVKSLDDVLKNGKKYIFGNGDPNSTSGFLVPSYYIFAVNKIDPKTHFKIVRNASHEANLLAIVTRQVDVATNNTMDFARFQKEQPEKAAQIRIIWKSPLIPNDPLVWRKDLPADLKVKIKAFILNYGKQGPDAERQRQVLAHLAQGWLPFHESNNSQLIPIRQLALAKEKMTIESSQNMAPQEKQAKLADIDAKLADLQRQAQHISK
ncbi:MAG: phosphonate ABC transporter substrate-binding protein [Candidatus Korobacteraceae bacterium]